jgi:cathepsin A (carboxypeptidase C)
MDVNQAFALQGDGMHNSAALLPELLADGIRLLVYAGEYPTSCIKTFGGSNLSIFR